MIAIKAFHSVYEGIPLLYHFTVFIIHVDRVQVSISVFRTRQFTLNGKLDVRHLTPSPSPNIHLQTIKATIVELPQLNCAETILSLTR